MARRTGTTSLEAPQGDQLAADWAAVQVQWVAEGAFSTQTLARFTEIGERFVRRLHAVGVQGWTDVSPRDCSSFIHASTRTGSAPRAATQRSRRAVVRAIFRTLRGLGRATGDPSLDLALEPVIARPVRPLTDHEIELGRAGSRLSGGARSLATAALWALAETGAATGELAGIHRGDLDDATNPRSISLPASRRYAGRVVELTDWGSTVLARYLASRTDDRALVYGPRGPGGAYRAQASVCTRLDRILQVAGLASYVDVRARSIRGWAGRSRFDAGEPLEQVAAYLGCRSLDVAAEVIGLRGDPNPRSTS